MSDANTIERKLQMIVGEDYGPSHHRCEARLQRMVPKMLAAGGAIPQFVRDHVEKNGLDVDLGSGKPKKKAAPAPEPPAEGDG